LKCPCCGRVVEPWHAIRVGRPRSYHLCHECALDVQETARRVNAHARVRRLDSGAELAVRPGLLSMVRAFGSIVAKATEGE